MLIKTIATLIALFLNCFPCFAMEKVFYTLRNADPIEKITPYAKYIDILISQAYYMDKNGNVSGAANLEWVRFANKHHIKFMPMITNANFDKISVHEFLTHPAAQAKALKTILETCMVYHFYGAQFDLEMVPLKDKKLLTKFYVTAANVFRANGLVISFAVAPTLSDGPFKTTYEQKMYENWAGAYDLPVLGKVANFITVMTYDQHIGKVAPGPIASATWIEAVLKHILKSIPAAKISLGIPTYSGFWYTGRNASNSIGLQYNALQYNSVLKLIQKHNLKLQWDPISKSSYVFYDNHWLNEYLFVENFRSFEEKLKLVKKYHLRGISVFRIGGEDPRIWNIFL